MSRSDAVADNIGHCEQRVTRLSYCSHVYTTNEWTGKLCVQPLQVRSRTCVACAWKRSASHQTSSLTDVVTRRSASWPSRRRCAAAGSSAGATYGCTREPITPRAPADHVTWPSPRTPPPPPPPPQPCPPTVRRHNDVHYFLSTYHRRVRCRRMLLDSPIPCTPISLRDRCCFRPGSMTSLSVTSPFHFRCTSVRHWCRTRVWNVACQQLRASTTDSVTGSNFSLRCPINAVA